MSIRIRLLISTVGIVAIFSVVVILGIWLGWQRNLQTIAEALTGEELARTEADLSEFAGPIEKQLLEAAQWGTDGLLSPDDPGQVEDLMQSLIREYPWMTASAVIDSPGRAFYIRRSGDKWQSTTTDPSAWGDRAKWAEWTDEVQEKVTYERPVDYDPRRESWFLGAIALYNTAIESEEESEDLDLIYWTEPHLLVRTQRPGMVAAVSFESKAGVDHVVAFELLLLEVHKFTSGIGVGGDTHALVMTDDLLLMGLPGTDEAMTDRAVEKLLLKEPGEVGIPLVADAVNALVEHVDSGGAVEFLSGEETWWGELKAYTLPGSEQRLFMGVMLPEHSLTGQLQRQLRTTMILTLLVAVLVIIWAIRVSRSISQPIEILAREGERLSRGDLEADPEVGSSLVEARRLSAALTQMRDSLSTLFQVEAKLRAAPGDPVQDLFKLHGYDIAGWTETADPGERSTTSQAVPHQIASVWDRFHLDGGKRAILFLADATGEGLESVFMATQARSLVRMAVRLSSEPGTVAATVNEQLYDDLPEGHFVSAWLGALESGSSTLTYVSAGIQNFFHYRKDHDRCESVTAETQPLGVFSTPVVDSPAKLTMEPGDVLAVVSDGVLSLGQTPGKGLVGAEFVSRILGEKHASSAEDILEGLQRALAKIRPGVPLSVDCSMIVVKRLSDG